LDFFAHFFLLQMTRDTIWPIVGVNEHAERGIYIATAIHPPDIVVVILRGRLVRSILPAKQEEANTTSYDLIDYASKHYGVQLLPMDKSSYVTMTWNACIGGGFCKNSVATLYNLTSGKYVVVDSRDAIAVEDA
jgi:hypothetical protein